MQTDHEKSHLRTAQRNTPKSRFAYAACATPPGTSGIAVIRMSGEDAFEIADPLFVSKAAQPISVFAMNGYTCAYGEFLDSETKEVLDAVILTKFIGPNSYTGEDTIEISCHGGTAVKNSILASLYNRGARPALPGEFTKHAFLNGKIDLTQAEAVMDLISATARKASAEAIKQLAGELSVKVRHISNNIYTLMSKVEMIVEFPEHEETEESILLITKELEAILSETNALLQSFKKGRILKEGLTVVIAGKPNAGKSSMLNTLAGYDRAIVTSIAGTTRDTIEEQVDIEGIPVRLVDTAGLRQSSDEVELIGIERARKAILEADIVFWIASDTEIDADNIFDNEEELKEIIACHQENALVIIIGKSDKIPFEKNSCAFSSIFPDTPVLPFSSVTKVGVDEVKFCIRKKYEEYGAKGSEEVSITNARHYHAAFGANEAVELALDVISEHRPLDLLATVLRKAADSLALITGDEVTEELVNEIFSRFCIGK